SQALPHRALPRLAVPRLPRQATPDPASPCLAKPRQSTATRAALRSDRLDQVLLDQLPELWEPLPTPLQVPPLPLVLREQQLPLDRIVGDLLDVLVHVALRTADRVERTHLPRLVLLGCAVGDPDRLD